ncbi:MAG: hypothetical protein QM817_39470 [Archangium sp.]
MLPVAGLVLSVVGLCFPPLLLVALGIGIYSSIRSRRDSVWAPRKQLADMSIAVSLAGTLIIGGMALPNYKRYVVRTKQIECKAVLARTYEAERSFYEVNKRYSVRIKELGIGVPTEHVLLRLAREGDDAVVNQNTAIAESAVPQLISSEIGLHGDCPACSISVLCLNEIDGDPMPDVWTVSTIERIGNDGSKIPGGVPWNEVDDVTR